MKVYKGCEGSGVRTRFVPDAEPSNVGSRCAEHVQRVRPLANYYDINCIKTRLGVINYVQSCAISIYNDVQACQPTL